MRLVSTAWIHGTFQEFANTMCLDTHRKIGYLDSDNVFEIFLFEGYTKIPGDVISLYRDSGIFLLDASEVFETVRLSFKDISGYGMNSYENNCFLRWPALQMILAGEPFLHVDTDIFFNIPISEVLKIFADKTGTFGSPCLTSISDCKWLDIYADCLREMIDDRSSFQQRLNHNGNNFRSNIGSDQDLIGLLNKRDILPSISFEEFRNYTVFTNPLWPYQHKTVTPMHFSRDEEVDSIDGRRVLFWHLQNNFSDYISRYKVLDAYKNDWPGAYLPVRLDLPFLQLRPTGENFAFYALQEASRQIAKMVSRDVLQIGEIGPLRFFSRTWVSDWFICEGQGRAIFSDNYWWEPGIFAR